MYGDHDLVAAFANSIGFSRGVFRYSGHGIHERCVSSMMLARQFEMAKMDAAQDLSAIKGVDKAKVPDKPSGPRCWRTILFVTVFFLLVAVVRAFVKEGVRRSRANPAKADRWAMFDQYRAWCRPSRFQA
jgi:hypothetical protein